MMMVMMMNDEEEDDDNEMCSFMINNNTRYKEYRKQVSTSPRCARRRWLPVCSLENSETVWPCWSTKSMNIHQFEDVFSYWKKVDFQLPYWFTGGYTTPETNQKRPWKSAETPKQKEILFEPAIHFQGRAGHVSFTGRLSLRKNGSLVERFPPSKWPEDLGHLVIASLMGRWDSWICNWDSLRRCIKNQDATTLHIWIMFNSSILNTLGCITMRKLGFFITIDTHVPAVAEGSTVMIRLSFLLSMPFDSNKATDL